MMQCDPPLHNATIRLVCALIEWQARAQVVHHEMAVALDARVKPAVVHAAVVGQTLPQRAVITTRITHESALPVNYA